MSLRKRMVDVCLVLSNRMTFLTRMTAHNHEERERERERSRAENVPNRSEKP